MYEKTHFFTTNPIGALFSGLYTIYSLLFLLFTFYWRGVFFYAGYKEEIYTNNMFVRKTRWLEDLYVLE